MLLYLIAAAGLVWMYISLTKGLKQIKKRGLIKGLKDNRYLRDFAISCILVAVGVTLFVGVTGMIIGLIASVLISIYIQLSALLGKKKESI